MKQRLCGLILLLVLAGLLGTALVRLTQHKSAHAASCTPIPGHPTFTAVVINPTGTVSGIIDATGCTYGVYVGPGHSATIKNADIFGANSANVAVDGTATVTNSYLHASPDGIDFGEFNTVTSGTALNNTIEYTDNGCGIMVWVGTGGSVRMSHNSITGPGTANQPFAIDAFGSGRVIVDHNSLTNNNIGVVLFPIGSGSQVTNNALVNNATGIETKGTNTLISSNSLKMGTTGIDPDGTNEQVKNNAICAYTTPIETADAASPPTLSGNATNC